jgi:hypothetical protein
MSDHPQEQSQKKRPARTRTADPNGSRKVTGKRSVEPIPSTGAPQPLTDPAANAALALAVSSAKRSAALAGEAIKAPASTQADASPRPAVAAVAGLGDRANGSRPVALARRVSALAAVVALAFAGGWFGGQNLSGQPSTVIDIVRGNQADVKALKLAVEALEESFKQARAEADLKQAQLMQRLERGPQETLAGLARIAEQVQRIEAAAIAPSAQLVGFIDQLDRIEKHLGGTPPKPAPAAAPATAAPSPISTAPLEGGVTEIRMAAKDAPVDGWVLHDVYDGVALIEGRNKRLLEVVQGETVPGVGRVEGIERRGKRWVVITAKGLISTVR